jgi:hypothetical protein
MSAETIQSEGRETEPVVRERLLALIAARSQMEHLVASLQENDHIPLSERLSEVLQTFDDEVLAMAERWWRTTL